MLIGYARCSTGGQDLEIQLARLATLGVDPERIYTDHGYSGAHRHRPGLAQALAALRPGDELVVPALDRLGRSVADLCQIATEVTGHGAVLNLGGSIHDPDDPFGRVFFHLLAAFAQFERDVMRARTREGVARAKARGRYKGRGPKLSPAQRAHLLELWAAGEHTGNDLAELFKVGKSTIYREFERAGISPGAPLSPAPVSGVASCA